MIFRIVTVAALLAFVALAADLLGAPSPARPLAAQTCALPPSGMLAWWRAEEDPPIEFLSNTAGTLIGDATTVAGHVGNAFAFDGTGDRFNTNVDLEVPITFSIDAWINPDTLPGAAGFRFIASKGGGLDPTFEFSVTDGGRLQGLVTSGAGGQLVTLSISNTGVEAGSWQHVAMTYDGRDGVASSQRIRFYINGQRVPASLISFDTGGIPNENDDFVLLGSNFSGSSIFDGLIDEVELFDRVLSQGEVEALYLAGSAGKCVDGTATVEVVKRLPTGGGSFDLLFNDAIAVSGAINGATTGPMEVTEGDFLVGETAADLADYVVSIVCSDQDGNHLLDTGWFQTDETEISQQVVGVSGGDEVLCVITNVLVPEECRHLDLTNVIFGGGGRDVLRGTADGDLIFGLGGDDYIYSNGGGSDCVAGGEGDDRLRGDSGDTLIEGNGAGFVSTPGGTTNEAGDNDDGGGDNQPGENDQGDDDAQPPSNDENEERPRSRPSRR